MAADIELDDILTDDELGWLVGIVERANEGVDPDPLLSDECNAAVYALAGETLSSNPDGIFEVIVEHEVNLRESIENPMVNRALLLALRYADAADQPGCVLFLGYLRKGGIGMLQDFGAAADLFERASDLGVAQATLELGVLYATGRGRSTNAQRAYRLFSQAALTDGIPEAFWRLGDMYRDGEFVKRDLGCAFRLYDNAFERTADHPALRAVPAHRLADLLVEGVPDKVERDPRAALLLYAQAEVGYYLLMDAGERDLQTALDLSIAGQARAREAIAEQRASEGPRGVSEETRNRIAERLASFMDSEFLSDSVASDAPRKSWGRGSGPRHFRS